MFIFVQKARIGQIYSKYSVCEGKFTLLFITKLLPEKGFYVYKNFIKILLE